MKKASDFLKEELSKSMNELIVNTPHFEEFIIDAMVNYSDQENRLIREKWNKSIARNQDVITENDALWNLLLKFSEAYYKYGIKIPTMNVLIDEIENVRPESED